MGRERLFINYQSCVVQPATRRKPDGSDWPGGKPWFHSNIQCGYCGDEHEMHLCCSALEYTGRKEWHCGEPELITWRMPADAADPEFEDMADFEEDMGWGGTLLEEEDHIKEKFTKKCKSDPKAFHKGERSWVER